MDDMSVLADYSIESDEVVFLRFRDGQSTRVNFDKLPTLLASEEVARIQQTLARREAFIRSSLPVWARSIALALGVIAIAASGAKVAQQYYRQPQALPKIEISQPASSVGGSVAQPVSHTEPSIPAEAAPAVSAPALPVTSPQIPGGDILPIQDLTQQLTAPVSLSGLRL